jgi:hypothetical protein
LAIATMTDSSRLRVSFDNIASFPTKAASFVQ